MFKGMMKALLVAMCLVGMAGGATAAEVQSKSADEVKAKIFVQLGHSSSIYSVAYSPDGHIAASGSSDKNIKLWDVASGRELRTLTGHSDVVGSVAFSPDGRTIVSASWDETIKLWEVSSGLELYSVKNPRTAQSMNIPRKAIFGSVAFSPDGRTIAAGDIFGSLWILDAASGKVLNSWICYDYIVNSSHSPGINSFAYSSDGRTIVTSGDHDIKVWEASTGRQLRSLSMGADLASTIALSPDGHTLVASRYTKDTTLWDISNMQLMDTLLSRVSISAAAFSPDGHSLVTSTTGTGFTLWDVDSRRDRSVHPRTDGLEWITSLAFSPNGHTVVSGHYNGVLSFWDTKNERQLNTVRGHSQVKSIAAISKDGRTFATGSSDNRINLWDAASGRVFRVLSGHEEPVTGAAFSPDGRTLVSISNDTKHNRQVNIRDFIYPITLKLWDIDSVRELGSHSVEFSGRGDITSIAFSEDGQSFAFADPDDNISLWDTKRGFWDSNSGHKLRAVEGAAHVKSLAFSSDGKILASGASNWFGGAKVNSITIWDVASGKELRVLSGQDQSIWAIALSRDGRTLVSSGYHLRTKDVYVGEDDTDDPTVKLWDVASGQVLHTLKGPGEVVTAVDISPDGRIIVSGSFNNTLTLWEAASGKQLHTLAGHGGKVESVRFSPDGKYVFSGSYDGTVRKWDVATGKEIIQYVSLDDGEWIAITPEGYYNASEKGGDWLNVRLGNKVQGINQFYDVFYRPDIVEAKLRGEDITGMINLTIDDAMKTPPPDVAFTTVPSTSSATKEKVCYKITSTGGGIGEVRLFQNSKLVKSDGFYREAVAKREDKIMLASADGAATYRSMRSLKMIKGDSPIQIAKSKGDVVEECQEIEAIPGDNELEVTAFNAPNTVQSAMGHASFKSTRAPEAAHLYVLAVGINEFSDSSVNLKYATKDALDFQKLMQEKSGTLFGQDNIHVTALSNAQASKQGILGKINELAGQVKPWDSFILFVASHGVMFGTQYYLVSSSFDGTADEKNLLGSNEIVELSKKIRALNQLYIFDTCHAGGVDNIVGGLYDARMSVLAKKMGLHIYASAGGLQEALDGYQGNGLFTHTLLASMNAANQTDTNHDGKVTAVELGKSARDMTSTISTKIGHPQTPTMIHFGKDVAVFEVPK